MAVIHDNLDLLTLILAELLEDVVELGVERVGITVGHSSLQDVARDIVTPFIRLFHIVELDIGFIPEDFAAVFRVDFRRVVERVDEALVLGKVIVDVPCKVLTSVLDEFLTVSRNGCSIVDIVECEERSTEQAVQGVTEHLVHLLHHVVYFHQLFVTVLFGLLLLNLQFGTTVEQLSRNLRNDTFDILAVEHLVLTVMSPRRPDEDLLFLLGKHIVNRLDNLGFRADVECHHD